MFRCLKFKTFYKYKPCFISLEVYEKSLRWSLENERNNEQNFYYL